MTHLQAQQRRRNMGPYIRAGETYGEVATRFRVCIGVVFRAAKELKIGRGQGRIAGRSVKFTRFAGVDWSKRDAEIGREVGCTRERVRQVRLGMRKPRALHHHLQTETISAVKWLRENLDSFRGMSGREIAKLAPIKLCYATWLRAMKRVGLEGKPEIKGTLDTRDALKHVCAITESGCWEWSGSRNKVTGYGIFSGHDYVHRFAYKQFIGDIPAGLCVMHSCDNPPCANPDHLFIGTDQDNTDDSMAKGRRHHRNPTPEIVRAVRAVAEKSNNFYEIGKSFGMSGSAAWKIAKRKTYKNVA